MTEDLTSRFERNRKRLTAVAYRMLGSSGEADDAVQEAWLRLNRSDASDIDNLDGWLTTVTARVCLDMLRSRSSRREEALDEALPVAGDADPTERAMIADAIGPALLVVLDTLSPSERLAFVLHDMFAVPFDEIATIVDRTPDAARQLASRARRRVQGADVPSDPSRQRKIVEAFLAASREGNFETLVSLLDPSIILRADEAAVQMGADGEVRGAREVASTFSGRARAAQPALIDGDAGLVWSREGRPVMVFLFTVDGDAITGIEMVASPDRIDTLEISAA